jgi:pimeloyl-ACP methyl ester carboxylesterase
MWENRDLVNDLGQTMLNLRKKVWSPKTGHWVQQEGPTEINMLLIEFLAGAL